MFDIDGTSDPDSLNGVEKPRRSRPRRGRSTPSARPAGTAYRFNSREQYEQFIQNPGCCATPTWTVL